MTVYLIYITFIIFVILLLIIGTYFMLALNMLRIRSKKVEVIASEVDSIMRKHMKYESIEAIPNDEIEMLKRKVSTRNGLQAFFVCYKEYVDENGYIDKAKDYAARVLDYKVLLNNRIVRDKYRKSYILYLLGEFRINTKDVEDFAIESLDNSSIYVRNNALRVVRNSGNVPLLIRAIENIENLDHYFNNRVLVDLVDTFIGDKELLDEALLDNIDRFSVGFRKIAIEHFTNTLNDKDNTRVKILNTLSDSKEKELIIAATKYFGKIIDERARDYILTNLDSEDWEVRAISARVIAKYNNKDSRAKLLESLKDRNYFVRFNSAFSYIEMEEFERVLDEVNSNMDDPYAKEITIYAMYSRKMLDYQEYKNMSKRLELEVSVQ